jgi:hypothetical protein
MLTPEQFEEVLLEKLVDAKGDLHRDSDGFLRLPIVMFPSMEISIDLRAYMDSNLQTRILTRPYCYQYIICKSTSDELVFFDLTPEIREFSNCRDLIYRSFNCDTNKVEEVLVISLKEE